MGEPIIASITCGSIAIVMLLWNWRMYEVQKHRGKICARACAEQARLRSKLRADARANAAAAASDAASDAASSSRATTTCVPATTTSKSLAVCSSSHVIKLETMPECNEASSDSRPLCMNKAARDRLDTAQMSPPLSSARSRSGTGVFFTDGFEANKSAGEHCLSLTDLDMALL